MNRFLKWLLALIGFVAILLIVVAIVLPKIIDPNNYKEKIRTAVLEKTGRELTIGGEIGWSVFPSIGLDLSDLSLSNRAGFGDQPMLNVGEARVSVSLIPIFSKKIEVGQVNLTGVSAYLRQNANGQNNWEDLMGAVSGVADAGALVESEIEITNGTITLLNTNQSIGADTFSGSPAGIDQVPPFDLEGNFSVKLVQEELVGEVQFHGLVQPSVNGRWIGIEGGEVSFKGEQGIAPEATPLDMTATANAEVDLSTDQATLSDIVFRFFDLTVNGGLKVTSLLNSPSYAGEFKLAEFSPKSLIKDLGMGALKTQDDAALTKMWGDVKFVGSPGNFTMQDLSVKLDKSTFKGDFVIKGTDNPQLAYNFEIDSLNLDDYSAVVEEGSGDGSAAESGDPIQAFGVFFILPGGGDLRIGSLVTSGLTVTDISVKTNADVNALRMFPISAKLYGGQQQGDIKIDISGSRPILTTNQVLTGVQMAGLLKDLTGNARLQGTGDFYMKVRTDLTSSDIARRALTGDIGLSIIDGAIDGIDVAETISAVRSLMGQQTKSTAGAEQGKRTEFAEFIVTGVFDKGILRSDDLLIRSPLLIATGEGTINLVNETINYVLSPELVDDPNVEGTDQFSGVPIPIKVTGNLYEPDFSLDVIAGLTGSQKASIDKKKDELTNTLLEEVFGSKKDKKKKKKNEKQGDGGS